MTFENELRTRAERAYDQRSLERLSAGISDPGMKDLTRQYASGQVSAAQILQQVEQSPAAMRKLEQRLRRYAEMPHDEIAALGAQRAQEISKIEAELVAMDQAASRSRRSPRQHVADEEEPSWEDRKWKRKL
jgi:hypothetical protein